MHHVALDRTGPDQRDGDDQVGEAARLHAGQHLRLGARLDLEHANRVPGADQVVDGRVVEGQAVQVGRSPVVWR